MSAEDATSILAEATKVWAFACQHATHVSPTLFRRDGERLLPNVAANHDAGDARDLMNEGIFPVIPSSPELARARPELAPRTYGPLWRSLGVYEATFVSPATLALPEGPRRVLMAWTYHPAESIEVTWCKGADEDGALRDVSFDGVQLVGTDWIKAAM